jgi:hypothetical protein
MFWAVDGTRAQKRIRKRGFPETFITICAYKYVEMVE